MKTTVTPLALGLLLLGTVPAPAQEVVTSGTVTAVSRQDGGLTLLPGASQRPVYFRELHRARLLFGSGKRATFADFREGQLATVYYTRRADRWYVVKVVLADPSVVAYPAMPPGGLTTAERRGTTSRAATDGDITTQPGSKARIDRDITTQPGSKDPSDSDITKRTDRR